MGLIARGCDVRWGDGYGGVSEWGTAGVAHRVRVLSPVIESGADCGGLRGEGRGGEGERGRGTTTTTTTHSIRRQKCYTVACKRDRHLESVTRWLRLTSSSGIRDHLSLSLSGDIINRYYETCVRSVRPSV